MTALILAGCAVLSVWLARAIHRRDRASAVHRATASFGCALAGAVLSSAASEALLSRGAASHRVESFCWASCMVLSWALVHLAARLAAWEPPRWVHWLHAFSYGGLAAGAFTPWQLSDVAVALDPPRLLPAYGPLVSVDIGAGMWAVLWFTILVSGSWRGARSPARRSSLAIVVAAVAVSGAGMIGTSMMVIAGRQDLDAYTILWALPVLVALLVVTGRYGTFDLSAKIRSLAATLVRVLVATGLFFGGAELIHHAAPARTAFIAGSVALFWCVLAIDSIVGRWLHVHLDRAQIRRRQLLADLALALSPTTEHTRVEQLVREVVQAEIGGASARVVTMAPTLWATAAMRRLVAPVDARRLDDMGGSGLEATTLESLLAAFEARALFPSRNGAQVEGLIVLQAPADLDLALGDIAFLSEVADLAAGPLARAALVENTVHLNEKLTRANAELEQRVGERTLELVQAHQEVVAAQKELARKDRLAGLGQLAGGVAHEFNNPLAVVIQNYRSLLGIAEESGSERLADVREIVEDALAAADRMATIVRDLRRAAAASETERKPLDVRDAIAHAVTQARDEVRSSVPIEMDLGQGGMVLGAIDELSVAITHLVRNALRSEATRVSVRVARRQGAVVLQIADDGRGISADAQRRIFDPFGKIGAVGEGRGLGLAVTWGIVQRHHGTLRLCSEPGEGSTFEIELPAIAEPPGDETAPRSVRHVGP